MGRRGLKEQDTVMAVCWIILGFIISMWSATFPLGNWESLGPAIFPLGSGLILFFLGNILYFQARKRNERKPMESFVSVIPRGEGFSRVALALGGMLLSAALLDILGFLLTFFFLILILLRAIQPQKWRVDILYTLVFTLGAYMLFQILLKTELPVGFLGF